ncbi:MAG: purine-binding chemotaxis protein CheW [Armatimonadetes bacterium]|nr:purine-binding chemotaxis protein CheW [Armatimonadota bacterium]
MMAESKFVVFKIGAEFYGLAIENVERILASQQVTRIPRAPKVLLGVFELRGDTIPVLDVRRRFDLADKEGDTNFIICLTEWGRCGFRVDGVDGIAVIHEENIDKPTASMNSSVPGLVTGIGKSGDRLVVLIDPNNMLPAEIRSQISKYNQQPAA